MVSSGTYRTVVGVLGVVHTIWGIAQIVMTFTSPCAFKWSVSEHYRPAGADDLGYGMSPGAYHENQFSSLLLSGIATLTVGIGYLWQIMGMSMNDNKKSAPWFETIVQIDSRFRPSRWIIWGIAFALIIAQVSFYAAVEDTYLVAALAILSIPLHYLQSENEAMNTDMKETTRVREGEATEEQALIGLADSKFTKLPRAEAWCVAFLIWVFIGLVWFLHLGFSASSATSTMRFFEIFIPIMTWVVYAGLHVAILLKLTNYGIDTWDTDKYGREWAYIAVITFIVLFNSISSVAATPGSSCPT